MKTISLSHRLLAYCETTVRAHQEKEIPRSIILSSLELHFPQLDLNCTISSHKESMKARLPNLVIQPITNEGRSLNQDQISNHAVIDIDPNSENDTLRHGEPRKMRRIKWSLLLGSFTLEGFSIAFEQLSAPKKPIYAFMSMITASLGLLISIIELSFRLQENDMIISRLLGDALENFGFFGSIWQCIFAVVQYIFLYKKKINNPIKISVLPLIFLICATMSRLYNIYRLDIKVYRELVERTKSIPGAKVENNKFCLSVHYRFVDEKKWVELAEQVGSVTKKYPKLQLTYGRKVLEIRPTKEGQRESP